MPFITSSATCSGSSAPSSNVSLHRCTVDFERHSLGRIAVHISDDDRFRAVSRKPPAQRAPDAVAAASDDDDAVGDVHEEKKNV
jgi:hypothetical protein